MLIKRLLKIFSIIILAIVVVILIAIVGLFVYEPSPAEGFAFSSEGETIQLSDGRTEGVIELLKNSIASATLAMRLVKGSEWVLAVGDLLNFGEDIKNKSLKEVLRLTKTTLHRIRNTAPQDFYLPEP